MVFYTSIETQVIFKILLVLVTGQLEGEFYLLRIRLFFGIEGTLIELELP